MLHTSREVGYPLDTIFLAGHSMGGAFLEMYVPDNLRPNYAGVLLYGSWYDAVQCFL